MIKTIIFDWGGVLTIGKYTESVLDVIDKRSTIDIDEVYTAFDNFVGLMDLNEIDFEEFVEKANRLLNSNFTIEEMTHIFHEAMNLNKEIVNMIKKLKGKYSILMLSNNNKPIKGIFKNHYNDIFSLFEKAYFSCDFAMRKPEKEFFMLVLKDSQLTPDECVFIDDKDKNIEAARELGFNAILFRDNDHLIEDLKKLNVVLLQI